MKIMKCDYEGCEEEIQILDMNLPKNWLYIRDFEYCPNCQDKVLKDLEDNSEEEWECYECGNIWNSDIEPDTNGEGEYCCDNCI
jgi:hypothetical protein